MKGKVYIVGAGPGDIGLLTVKGLMCLRKADVVVYDYHLNAQVLNYINHKAEFIYAGKRGGHHTLTQEEINHAIVEKAREGKVVCRLKGGDPFIFGRGGEEAEVLAQEAIEFEVVPGISSAVAAPAYAGIPLTHRQYSSSFAVVPGYEDVTKKGSSIDWTKLATGVGTIVFLMTVKNLPTVCERLIENGRDPGTPVAVIRWGTRPEQTTLESTLKNISQLVRERDVRPPAVMIIGDVVRLRKSLRWYEKKPLFGQRILVTREHADSFGRLADLGAEIFEFPTIEVVPPSDWKALDDAIEKIESYNWLIFTSANGVKYFFRRFFDRDRDIRDMKGLKICTVGSRTASVVRTYGMKVDLIPESFSAEGLIEAFCSDRGTPGTEQGLRGIRMLLPRAEIAREVFPEKVREAGGEIDVVPAYRTVKPELHGKRLKRFLKEKKVTIATFTSAATFNNFVSIMDEEAGTLLKDIIVAVIGPVTAHAVTKAGLRVHIMAESATIESLVGKIIEWVTKKPHFCDTRPE